MGRNDPPLWPEWSHLTRALLEPGFTTDEIVACVQSEGRTHQRKADNQEVP